MTVADGVGVLARRGTRSHVGSVTADAEKEAAVTKRRRAGAQQQCRRCRAMGSEESAECAAAENVNVRHSLKVGR